MVFQPAVLFLNKKSFVMDLPTTCQPPIAYADVTETCAWQRMLVEHGNEPAASNPMKGKISIHPSVAPSYKEICTDFSEIKVS